MSNFRGMVTEAPPKSGACRSFSRALALSVSNRVYSWGRPVALKAALCMAGDLDWAMGLPKR